MAVNESRREFLRVAGKALGSAALVAAAAPVVTNCKAAVAESAPATHPFPYVELDPAEIEKRGYDSFFKLGGCCAGAADALIGTMADKVGYPFNQIPITMFANGAAGYGAGTLCGSLGGAVAFIGLVCEPAAAKEVTAELFGWYRTTAFPLYKPETELDVSTVSGSVNCVDSVTPYMEATGLAMGDLARKQRCAGVTADVARKTAELLNIHYGFAAAPVVEEAPAAEAPAANEYIGVGTSEIGGEVKVKVTMDGDKIAKIEVLSHSETPGLSDPAFAQIPEAIIAANSTEVDVVSGATKTSEALIAAVNDALSQIK